MAKLRDILKSLDILSISGDSDIEISSICFDSRKAGPGSLFVAVGGTKSDGHDFIEAVLNSGTPAIICEKFNHRLTKKTTVIIVKDSAEALGLAASAFYGNPSANLKLTGVTGTNGKTTIATLLYHTFRNLGYKCGLFSTVCNYVEGRELNATHTTPDPVQLNMLLAEMVECGCEFAFMEVS
jgi:UDP-N-acetylmuramoyl-L-alanyl-D-glutamate--2,6-diaminopimelate ligase